MCFGSDRQAKTCTVLKTNMYQTQVSYFMLIKTLVFGSWNLHQNTSVSIAQWNLWCSNLDGSVLTCHQIFQTLVRKFIRAKHRQTSVFCDIIVYSSYWNIIVWKVFAFSLNLTCLNCDSDYCENLYQLTEWCFKTPFTL